MDGTTPAVSTERAERLMEALSLVAIGEYDAAFGLLPEPGPHEAVSLESCVRVLVTELAASQAANLQAMARLEQTSRELAERVAVVERQRVTLSDLSTPLIEVGDGTLALPVIGAVDLDRAQVMGERLLHRVTELRVRNVLLDLTGMAAGDATTVENIVRIARGVELLGARCTITGISPGLAHTLVEQDLDLRGLHTCRTLQDGLLEFRRRAPTRAPERT